MHIKSFGYNTFKGEGYDISITEVPIDKRLKDMANMGDVLFDTLVALKRGPTRHVTAGNFLSLSREEQANHGKK